MAHPNDGKTIYSIHERPKWNDEIGKKFGFGACIVEEYSLEEAKEAASNYFRERAEEEGNYGDGEEDLILITHVWDTGEEKEEPITITWYAERDTYDGGRFDYLAGIGAI